MALDPFLPTEVRATIVAHFPERGYAFAHAMGERTDIFVHVDRVIEGELTVGAEILCEVDAQRQRPRARRVRVL